jgi:hypothetical protein
MECMNDIDLNNISRDFHNMRRDVLWAVCPHCESNLLPKIGISLGNELNRYHKLAYPTSTYEAIVLYSPFFLKYNYNNGLLREFGNKLDVENFKMRFNAVFWDSIWYFKLKNLEFDFMLPYEYNPNMNIFNNLNGHIKVYGVPAAHSRYQQTIEMYSEKIMLMERRATKLSHSGIGISKLPSKEIKDFKDKDSRKGSKSTFFQEALIIQDRVNDIELLPLSNTMCDNHNFSFSNSRTEGNGIFTHCVTDYEDNSNFILNSDKTLDTDPVFERLKQSCPLELIREESCNTILTLGEGSSIEPSPIIPNRRRTKNKLKSDLFLNYKLSDISPLEEIVEFDDGEKDKTPM